MLRSLLVAAFLLPAALSAQDSLIAPRARGSVKAPVTVFEMSDFQCPYCKQFTDSVLPTIQKEYVATGKVRWIFINFPLPPSKHPNAEAAAEFAMCAARQGKFWPTHNMLYSKQDTWAPMKDPVPFFSAQIPTLGLNRDLMMKCVSTGAERKEVQSDLAGAQRTGANSTPSFFVEGGLMAGVYPIKVWRQVLDSVIKIKQGKKP